MQISFAHEQGGSILLHLSQLEIDSFRQPADELLRKGYTFIPFPNQSACERVATTNLDNFLNQSPEKLFRWQLQPQKPYEIGYIRRARQPRPSGGFYDEKDIFHEREAFKHLVSVHGLDFAAKDFQRFFTDLAYLREYSYCLAHKLAEAIDIIKPEYEVVRKISSASARQLHMVRVVNYRQKETENTQLAQCRASRDLFSIRPYESRPGLRYGDNYVASYDEKGKPIHELTRHAICHVNRPGYALVLAGKELFQLSKSSIGPIYRDVITIPTNKLTPEETVRPRRSVILSFYAGIDLIDPYRY